jgi:hypothetical protein
VSQEPKLTQTGSPTEMPTGVTKTTRWYCDVFAGKPEALIAAGIIKPKDLLPQKGRAGGRTVFLADGRPCPLNYRAWRDPGYRVVLDLGDGSYTVEVTVPKDVQAARRKAERAAQCDADHEERQQRINEELAKKGKELRNWELVHRFGESSESWEGTKEQLQAQGLGVGMPFPGEPGAPERVDCKCPLGFDVRISIPTHEPVKAAAGIFEARSWYLPLQDRETEPPKQFAPGVLLQAWPEWSTGRDTYIGTGEALVAAGLVPSLSLLPGQPGQPKMQVTYTKKWGRCPAGHREGWGATIQKRGTKKFSLELRVSDEEAQRREEIVAERRKETKAREAVLARERRELREIASAKVKGVDEFRAERMRRIETDLEWVWRTLIRPDGALRFEIPEGSEHWDSVADAFQTIRDVVESAEVIVDKDIEGALQKRLKLTAARNDKGVQSLLHGAKHLRLVHSTPDNEEG